MNKGIIPLVFGLLGIAQVDSVIAQDASSAHDISPYWYAGVSIGEGLYPGASDKDTERTGLGYIVDGLHLGYRFSSRWSGELELQNLGSVGVSNQSSVIQNYSQLLGSVRLHLPLLSFADAYLKTGLSRWWEIDNENAGFTGVLGGGVSYALRDNLDVRAEYQYTHNLSDILTRDSNHHLAMFSLLLRFGQTEASLPVEESKVEVLLPEVKKTIVSLSGNAQGAFAHNSSYLMSTKPFEAALLDLKRYANARVIVSGHTDTSGSESYNLWLSERRALRVADYFSSQGVDPTRIVVKAFGESKPIADNSTEQGRAENRRVEIELFMAEE